MECNVYKMREALDRIGNTAVFVAENCGNKETAKYMTYIIMDVQAAVCAPPRNCDVGTAEEQERRFRKYCLTEECNRYRCRHGCKSVCIDRCAVAWSQMPYEAEEGGAK